MKTFSKKLPAVVNLPITWTDEDWAKPLVLNIIEAERCEMRRGRPQLTWTRRCAQAGRRRAFTLIEMLVVIAIIAILASILLPVLSSVKKNAKIKAARVDMHNIESAVSSYQSTYTLAPTPNPLPGSADRSKDFSFSDGNSDVTVILMDVTNLAANANHVRNPQLHAFLNVKTHPGTEAQGVSTPDYNFRDPWGNPYVIAFDLNYDNQVDIDGVASNPDLIFPDYPYRGIHQAVIIWSFGPDERADNRPDPQGRNKDNIKSWE